HGVGRDQVQEGVDHPWVEMATPTGLDLFERLVQAEGRAIDPVGHHGVEGIGNRNDARAKRDVLTLEALGIAGAVEFLVVMPDQRATWCRPSTGPMMSAPICGCRRIQAISSSVSAIDCRRMRSGMPILPTSWRIAPNRTAATSSRERPIRSAQAPASLASRSECPLVE